MVRCRFVFAKASIKYVRGFLNSTFSSRSRKSKSKSKSNHWSHVIVGMLKFHNLQDFLYICAHQQSCTFQLMKMKSFQASFSPSRKNQLAKTPKNLDLSLFLLFTIFVKTQPTPKIWLFWMMGKLNLP